MLFVLLIMFHVKEREYLPFMSNKNPLFLFHVVIFHIRDHHMWKMNEGLKDLDDAEF